MSDLRVVIAAAGRGSRAGLPYPKTLYPVNGVPILLRILELLKPYDATPTVVVSPLGEASIRDCFTKAGLAAHFVTQPVANGMGDAVLCFKNSPAFETAEHLLLIWGDIPLIQPETVKVLVHEHFVNANDFTFATRQVDSAYTVVKRDPVGRVIGVVETRELGSDQQQPGERDIGLFVFRKDVIFTALSEDLSGKFGKSTGEHGFLYVIEHLAKRGLKVEALPIATERDLISLNRLKDLDGICTESLK